MGLRIFLHSVRLVFSQLGDALRISGLLYLVTIVVSVIGFYSVLQTTTAGQQPAFTWQLGLAALVTALLYLWIAVAWHRFVLLDEIPRTPVPALLGDRMLAYFGRGLQLALIVMLASVAVLLLARLLSPAAVGLRVVVMAATLIMLTLIILVVYRLAPMFPGAAVGRSVGVSEAWASTRGATGSLLLLSVVSAIASFVIDLPAQGLGLMPQGGILGFVWLAITAWVKLMVGISILTTLYGVYVEKRVLA